MRVTTTDGLVEMASDSKGRNRERNPEVLRGILDPEGVHLEHQSMMHKVYVPSASYHVMGKSVKNTWRDHGEKWRRTHANEHPSGHEMRTVWLCKIKGSMKPLTVILDCSIDTWERMTLTEEQADEMQRDIPASFNDMMTGET